MPIGAPMLKPLPIALFVLLAACSGQDPKISLHDGWARETGQSDVAAAYVTIENKGAADKLIGVRSAAGEATLHETTMNDGVMRMRAIDPAQGMVVPSNGKLALAPGGAHVMIMGLSQPLKAGEGFDLTLQFARSKPKQVRIMVKPAAEGGMVH